MIFYNPTLTLHVRLTLQFHQILRNFTISCTCTPRFHTSAIRHWRVFNSSTYQQQFSSPNKATKLYPHSLGSNEMKSVLKSMKPLWLHGLWSLWLPLEVQSRRRSPKKSNSLGWRRAMAFVTSIHKVIKLVEGSEITSLYILQFRCKSQSDGALKGHFNAKWASFSTTL